jgi:hypothetical protein
MDYFSYCNSSGGVSMNGTDGYSDLAACLEEAKYRASQGKGAERHGHGGLHFRDQPILTIPRTVGNTGFTLGQIMKKAGEAAHMDAERAIKECQDIIVYAAATIIYLREQDASRKSD